ncbi:MAG TPA: sugar transferase [Nocardioidaceae bacterium]|nr:sugar transferase [Nocardioidaceae bacterium]
MSTVGSTVAWAHDAHGHLPGGARPAVLSSGTREAVFLLGVDALVLTAVLGLTRSPSVALMWGIAMVVWAMSGLYAKRFTLSLLDDLPKLALGVLCGVVLVTLLPTHHGLGLVQGVGVLLVASAVGRLVGYPMLRRARAGGALVHPAVIIGAGPSALALAERIGARPETGLRIVGFLDTVALDGSPAPLLGEPQDLVDLVHIHGVSDVIVAYGGVTSENLVGVLRDCYGLPVDIHVVPRFFEMHRMAGGSDQVWGIPLENVNRRPFGGAAGYLKRGIDVTHAALGLLLLAPVLAAVAFAVRLELGPGVFFRQVRVGLDGRPFTIRKFRSMRGPSRNEESAWTVTDPGRIGRVGAFIRRYSLDEIPQLFNVLVGDMSLVGPRPERPEYFQDFRREFPRYGHRSRVLPGLTGLAAVEGLRGDTSIPERAHFDNLYIENWSLWLDLKIVVRTVAAVLRGTGG